MQIFAQASQALWPWAPALASAPALLFFFNCIENPKLYPVEVLMCETLHYSGRENYLDDFTGE